MQTRLVSPKRMTLQILHVELVLRHQPKVIPGDGRDAGVAGQLNRGQRIQFSVENEILPAGDTGVGFAADPDRAVGSKSDPRDRWKEWGNFEMLQRDIRHFFRLRQAFKLPANVRPYRVSD